jgi:glucose/arabinose dehydrogenase
MRNKKSIIKRMWRIPPQRNKTIDESACSAKLGGKILSGLLLSFGLLWTSTALSLMLDNISLPAGFAIRVFADNVPNARQIALGPDGVVFVGSRDAGKVYRLHDADGDFVAEKTEVVASGLYMPSGVAYRDDKLFVAEVNRIISFEQPLGDLAQELSAKVVYDALPSDGHHGWKAIDFGPDNNLYVPVGAPCNVCEVKPPYGSILQIDLESKSATTYAAGVRNSVGFAWHPVTQKLWFSDNGRDWMGDDKPGCEINRVDKPGQHFGFPYIHASGIADDSFKVPHGLEVSYPAKVLDAHVAPLGLLFYEGEQFPEDYKHRLFVAQHGSWNRKKKIGYDLMMATINADGEVTNYETFASGWRRGQANWGRPVDIAMLPDGSLLLSDDHAGVIYRISYNAGANK